jgi:hypothetical protein
VPPFPDDGECVLVTTHFRAGYMVSLIS